MRLAVLSAVQYNDVPLHIKNQTRLPWGQQNILLKELEDQSLIRCSFIPVIKKGTRIGHHPVVTRIYRRYHLTSQGKIYLHLYNEYVESYVESLNVIT